MEAEPLDLEDGEIIDDEASDIETYNILKRPPAVSRKEEHSRIGYNDESDDSVDTESDSDSDSRHVKNKKPKLKLKRTRNSTKDQDNKNDKYKIWCTQVQEDSLTEDLVLCGVTKTHYQERNVENYNVPHRYSLNGSWNVQQYNNNSSEDEKEIERRSTNKRTNSDRSNVKLRLGKKRNAMDVDKRPVRKVEELSTTVESTDADVATDIASKLNEKKNVLIKVIVNIIGKEKAIDFFQKTRKIEETGGLLTMNGSRRRTAGGVYLWLVKNDENIPQEKIRKIFYSCKKEQADQKKADASTRRQKAQELIKCLENGFEKDLPTLLTKAELSTKEIAEEARLRRGEGMDRIPMDSDRTVTNPPPSPVTDDPDHSEHLLVQRHIQDYEEDFLDIGINIDSMEVL